MSRRRWIVIAVTALALVVALAVLLVSRDDGDEGDSTTAHVRAYGLATDADGRAFGVVERLGGDGGWRAALTAEDGDTTAELPLSEPVAIVADEEGRLLVAGTRVVDGRRHLAVARLHADGRRDASFQDDGVVAIPAGEGDAVARGLAVDRDGNVVVVGDAVQGDRHFIAVARVIGDRGGTSVEPIYDASAGGATTDRSGRVVVAGTNIRDGSPVLARARQANGLDLARAETDLTSATWRAVAATPEGGAVVVGSGRDRDARSVIAVQRFGPEGASAAALAIPAGDGDAYGAAAAAERDGRIRIAANASDGDAPAVFTVTLGPDGTSFAPPRRRAAGRVAGIAPGGLLLTTSFGGRRQRVEFVR